MENNSDDLITFGFQNNTHSIIKVVGVGGGGSNAVNYMYLNGIEGVDFVVCNTDTQSLNNSPVPVKIQLGVTLTDGKGAGNMAKRGEQAAIENLADVRKILETGTKMVFITAGMGGGTGTGAAPVIAQLAREMDILTIAVVTMPSLKEGKLRYDQALEGIYGLQRYVDSMLVISNENLHRMYGELPAREAFAKADNIVTTAVKGCAEIITLHGNINIDFADVNTVMRDSGVFIMGTGYAEGDNRAIKAVEEALKSPLLDSNDIYGTSNILLNITSCEDEIRMGEIGQIIDYLQRAAGDNANIIWGNGYDTKLGKKICVTIIATGFETNPNRLLIESPSKETVTIESFRQAAHVTTISQNQNNLSTSLSDNKPVTKLEDLIDSDMDSFEPESETDKVQEETKAENKKQTPQSGKHEKSEGITDWFKTQLGTLFSDDDNDIDTRPKKSNN